MKLELKKEEIIPYLPYDLKLKLRHEIIEMHGLISISERIISYDIDNKLCECEISLIKPILRPLSDLTKVNGFSLSDMISHGYHNPFWLPENFEVKYLMHLDFEKLVSWHFDVFGLIKKGLAIDINTLD